MTHPNGEADDRQLTGRATFLAIVLTVFFGSGVVVFLIVLTGGFILDVIVIIGALVLLGMLHYFLWGKRFDRAVEGEREELELQREAEEYDDPGRPPWERRF